MTAASVVLRPIEQGDLSFLRDLANDPGVRANVVGWDWPLSLAAQQEWFETGVDTVTTRRFIVENEDSEPVGLTGLWDIDWHNRTALSAVKIGGRPDLRGRGYGTGALWATMAMAFTDVGLHRLYSTILEFNAASIATYVEKSGWRREGVARQHVWRDGQYWDAIYVGILRDEYLAWKSQRDAGSHGS